MPTLSFACPKCAKTYDRVRPEMVGHKVRCSCGFVFRLGNKESKDPEAAERVRQKHAKKKAKLGMHKKSNATAKATKPKEDHFDLLPSGDVGNSVHSSQLPEQLLDDLPLLEGPKPTSSRPSQDTPSSDVQRASSSGKGKSPGAAPKKAKRPVLWPAR